MLYFIAKIGYRIKLSFEFTWLKFRILSLKLKNLLFKLNFANSILILSSGSSWIVTVRFNKITLLWNTFEHIHYTRGILTCRINEKLMHHSRSVAMNGGVFYYFLVVILVFCNLLMVKIYDQKCIFWFIFLVVENYICGGFEFFGGCLNTSPRKLLT